jgi:hypothetical protein
MTMTIPAIIFGVLLSTLYGAAFHFWRGGDSKIFLLYLVLAWAGFWLGQYVGELAGWSFWQTGSLNLGVATAGAALFLFAGYGLIRLYSMMK